MPTPRPPRSTARRATKRPTAVELRALYREMLLIRRFEERAARAYSEAKIGGYCHLNLGEEATVVGLMAALEPGDYLYANYREHGYALARGISPERAMAELYGRTDGVSKGWGGSMHMFDLDARFMGGYGIVGGQVPLATGTALAIHYRGEDDVVMCLMGDGTTNIGAFHESLNIAALWNLPIVYVVNNNGLGMGTTVEQSSAEPELHRRASSYRMPSARVDGFDPGAVREAARIARDSARAGTPYLLETMTGRMKGHSVVDPARYRTAEEAAAAKAADPVAAFAARLRADDVLSADDLDALDREVTAEVTAAAAFADASPHPDVSTLFDYTYATPVPNDARRLPGEALFPAAPRPARSLPEEVSA
ncbi:pyruvate/2-oxoglutarate dehydrogenase complex, dehydrogenase (E1) component, eukaryotic type, alpha subunit [Microbacterium testaceum StLB037]|uniref:Pyruvate dehydrogenase E1 component subunit alpha n=1 Tax=Microbacterium testaceum (strain StLB037) TaxID=979556 RepID=E8N8X4_MICTS|nr:pyruvate dehydrogenase (acetyl-transferring) E1 component subunit alpha [Microbacterium testaceum]BAJ73183.1 pyruvate/2-oxoglutarate dehydrogenase complex, dehydrogenase (E1) component, eukaryotic type, alpha subunit [Microbacterium testaceum StLB037]